jgi:hypothetical protein
MASIGIRNAPKLFDVGSNADEQQDYIGTVVAEDYGSNFGWMRQSRLQEAR